jgi:hypothetical protein
MPLLQFLESHELELVHLDLTVPCCEKGIDISKLFPAKPSESSELSIYECLNRDANTGCTDINVSIQSDPNVEQRVFEPGEPESYIRGYFIVSEYFTQQSLVEIRLKPVSVKDVEG